MTADGAPSARPSKPMADGAMPDLDFPGIPGDVLPAPTRRSRVRKIVIGLLEVAISAALLWAVFAQIDLNELAARLSHLSYSSGLFVAAILIVHAAISAIRWRVLMDHLGLNARLGRTFLGVLLERFVNQALPSTVGGDGARFVQMNRDGLSGRPLAYSIVVDRLFALGGIFGMVSLAAPFGRWVIKSEAILTSLTVIGILPVVGLTALLLIRQRWWIALHGVPLLRYPVGLAASLRVIMRNYRLFAIAAGTSLCIQALFIPCFLVLARDLGVPLGVGDAAVLIPMIMLANAIPVSVAGWGVRESAAVVLLAQAGIRSADAVLLSVLFGIISVLTGCAGGLFWLAMRHARRRSA